MIVLRSIRTKLVAVVMSTTLAALLVSVGTVIAYDLRGYHRALVSDLQTQAELLGHMTAAALAFDDPRLARENLALLRARPSVRAAAIYDEHARLFAWYRAAGERAPVPALPPGGRERLHGRELVLYRRIVENGDFLGTVCLRAENRLIERSLDYLGIAAGVTLLALLVAWLLVQRIGRVITAPIVAVTAIAREVVQTRDYSRRAPRLGNDEAAELAGSFNAMLTEIEQRTRQVMRMNEELEQRVDERTTQLALANAELEQAIEQALAASHAKSAFLSSMSHELRTPLNAILGFAQILSSGELPATPEQKREFAGHILRSGRHLLALINEILDLAKIESGTVALAMEPVALREVLAECRGMIAPLAAARGLRLRFPDDAGATVMADRTRLKQVLLNLLSNAVKYNRDGGEVVVECEAVPPDRVRLSVRDTGHGLTSAQLGALFQPFNRLGQENGPQEGTGIGLVVTRRLVELMKGTIGVSSIPGEGSVFRVELERAGPGAPAAPASARPPAVPAEDVPAGAHLLLYVEDNPANVRLVQEIVRMRAGLCFATAADGEAGLALARARRPALVLLDLNLPGMDGFQVLAELRRDPRTARIPAIALSANAMPHDVERGLAAGFFRYLTKPLDIGEFNRAVDAALALAGTGGGA